MGRGPGGAQLPPPLAGCRPVTRALPPPPEQIQGSSPAGPGPHVASGGKPAGVCWWTGQQCLKPGDGQVPSGHLSCGLGLGEGHPVARLATPVLTGPEGPGDPDLTSVLWGPSPFSSVGRPASQHVVSLPQPSAPPPGLGSRSVFSFCWEGWAGLALAGPGGLRPPPPSSVCRSQRPGGPARSGCGRVHSAARPPGRLAPPVPREAWPAALRGDRLLLQASRGSASHSGSPRPWSGGSPGAGRGGAEGPHEGAGKSGLRPPPDGLHILAPGVIAPWKITVRKMNPQRPLPTRGRPVRPGGRQPLVWRWLECVCRRAGGQPPAAPPSSLAAVPVAPRSSPPLLPLGPLNVSRGGCSCPSHLPPGPLATVI